MIVLIILYILIGIMIIFPLGIYPLSLILIGKCYPERKREKFSEDEYPFVELIISAYNEEDVIENKVREAFQYEYIKEKYVITVVSDQSNDRTDEIVNQIIEEGNYGNASMLKLLVVKGRRGKTYAQNMAVRESSADIIAFSDANSKWNKDALIKMVHNFKKESVGYVCGKLAYMNEKEDLSSESESTYWNLDLKIREIEDKVDNIVGGNGAIYCIRRSMYVELPDILSHDGFMPTKMVINEHEAHFEKDAVAYEYSNTDPDREYKRKVRMQRGQPWKKYTDFKKFNIFKYGWFSYFYFGHKYLKYLLYLTHIAFFIVNIFLLKYNIIFWIALALQLIFYFFAVLGYFRRHNKTGKILYFPYHYCMTIVAQIHSIVNTFANKNTASWERTRK